MVAPWRQRWLQRVQGGPLELYRSAKRAVQRAGQFAREVLRFCLPASSPFGLPKGSYSDSPLQPQAGDPPGRLVLADQGAPAVTERSLMIRCGLHQHQEQPWPIFWRQLPRAHLVGPSLAVLDQNKRVWLESAYGSKRVRADPAYNHFVHGSPTGLAGNWTSLISRWVPTASPPNFAHWLLDALPRLALLKDFPPDTRILVPASSPPFQSETLRWLGLTDRCRPTAETNLRVENYFFSSPVSMVVCYSPYAVDFLRANFLRFAETAPASPKRFFVRRTGPIRNVTNEAEVLQFFQTRGWAIVDTATLSMARQIQYFSQAEAICAIHGASLTNCVWCSAGCKVVELLADNYLNGCFEWICGVVKAEHSYRIFPADALLSATIDLKELENSLAALGL